MSREPTPAEAAKQGKKKKTVMSMSELNAWADAEEPAPRAASDLPKGPTRDELPTSHEESSQGRREESGYGRRDEGGYGRREEGGYGRREEGGYGRREEGGHGRREEGGYGRRDEGYGGGRREEGGYGRRDAAPARAPTVISEEALANLQAPYKLFVGNLSFNATEADIADVFDGLNVVNVSVITDRETGRAKGFAYVEFGSADDLRDAVKLSGRDLLGRSINLDLASGRRDGGRDFSAPRGGDRGMAAERSRYDYDRPELTQGSWRRETPLPAAGPRGGDRGGDRGERRGGNGGSRREGDERRSFGNTRSSSSEGAPAASSSSSSAPAAPSKPRSNPFGDAKPRDEAEIQRQIEERRKQREAEAKAKAPEKKEEKKEEKKKEEKKEEKQ